MKNIDTYTHLRGESIYLDDIMELHGTLYGACFDSPIAHGKVLNIDIAAATRVPGVVRIFTAMDCTGRNEIGGIIEDEPLLADGIVHFCGMPIAFVVATSAEAANLAVKQIVCDIHEHDVITDPRIAMQKNELIIPPRTFKLGNTQAAFAQCKYVIEGTAYCNGQEHLYIETQGAYAIPTENGGVKVYSSTQGPTAVQRACSKVLGIPMHMIEVDVTRLGGGFGGKEDQANAWAALCALATYILKKPVKYVLSRMEDMRMTGKRHPYDSDYKIGLNEDYKIMAYEAVFYQNAGAAADLSPAVLERTLFHCTNSYYIPHVTATAYSCRTHLPPNTAFRGFGGPQGMYVVECAIAKAADTLGVSRDFIQQKNLIKSGDVFPYGQMAESEAQNCWQQLHTQFDIANKKLQIDEFNATNKYEKKGYALMPICFGISFTKTLMNNARSLVHVYSDGSINISTGAVEMGQGVNTKILQVAQQIFAVDATSIKVNSTNTFRIANTSPSAASATADLNGKATAMACTAILNRLKPVAASMLNATEEQLKFEDSKIMNTDSNTSITWQQLVMNAFIQRISLSEHAHYATPQIHFDTKNEKGHPFAYHVYGTAFITTTVDCMRGTCTIDEVYVMHDAGQSMNEMIDRGQCEGGIVQGIGWMTMEEVVYDDKGKLRSNALSTYKVPDIYAAPKNIWLQFMKNAGPNLAINNSKAVGEPPLMYGIGAYFAIRHAVKAYNPEAEIPFSAPFTHEKILMALHKQ